VRIESFQFRDLATGWELEETKFDAFNLLVGVSGVGKTKILQALEQICSVAKPSAPGLPSNVDWTLYFEHQSHQYRWSATFLEPAPTILLDERAQRMMRSISGHSPEAAFVHEEIDLDGIPLVRRKNGDFTYQNKDLPKLNRSESAVVLLAGESKLEVIASALKSVAGSTSIPSPSTFSGTHGVGGRPFENVRAGSMQLEEIQKTSWSDMMLKAYLMQEALPERWGELKAMFASIFPSVADVKINYEIRALQGSESTVLRLALRDRSAKDWIFGPDLSSGMVRVLATMIGLALTPAGSVILIDEIENSLGKNCLPDLIDLILGRAPDFQFIITSHHPYVINNLPVSTWKLVQRRGSQVRVLAARDIPELQRASHFDAFDRLLNLPEYEDGIA
jgi:hypothetical protein